MLPMWSGRSLADLKCVVAIPKKRHRPTLATERDSMPVSQRNLNLTRDTFRVITFSASLVVLVSCSSFKKQDEFGSEARFRESASDVTSWAPEGMSPPKENAEVVTIDPMYMRTNADYHFSLGEAYRLEANSAKALEEYKLTLLYDTQSAIVRLRLASEYIKQGLVSESIAQAKVAKDLEPQKTEPRLLLGGIYSSLKMYDEALNEYKEILKIQPDDNDVTLFMGALYAEQKKYTEAGKCFETLAAPGGRSAYLAHYYLGRILLEENKQKNTLKAQKHFEKSVELKPRFADAALALGDLLISQDRTRDAIQFFAKYQEKNGPDTGVAEVLAKLYIGVGELEKALGQYEILEASDSENLEAKLSIAKIYIDQRAFSKAIVKLEEILGRAPYSDKIRYYLGAVYEEVKDYKNAITQFLQIPVASSYYEDSVIHAAYLFKLIDDYPKAIATVENGIKMKDSYPQFYALYAGFLDDLKEYDRAHSVLQQAVQKFPKNAQLHFYIGSINEKLGHLDQTEVAMKKVLEIDENHVQAMNYLAYAYAEQGKSLEEAERMARKALDLKPQDGYVMDTLGWVLYKQGKIEEAIRKLEAAQKVEPKESIIAEHLGDAYFKMQLSDKAKKMYQRATEIEKNADNLQKIRQKIVSIDQQIQKVERRPASSP